jgi:septal ring factor EnvC (AmiA/AmiB activator)
VNLTLITHLIAALAAASAAWFFQDARMDAAVAEVRLEQTNERLGAVSQARADERAITSTYQGALNAARTREALLRTEIDHLHRVSDGLRDQNADAARRLAAASPAAVLEYATALGAVFEDCRAAYAEVVEKADGHASDVRTLREAWPVIPPRPAAGSTP